jgi:hypothetical protein
MIYLKMLPVAPNMDCQMLGSLKEWILKGAVGHKHGLVLGDKP